MEGDTQLAEKLARVPWLGPRFIYRLQQAGRAYEARSWPEVAAAVIAARPPEISVDVFDTCVVRRLLGDHAVEHAIDHVHGRQDPDGTGEPPRTATADAVERLLCLPVPGAAESLKLIREAGVAVTFLSDTDRSSDLLIDILRNHGIFVDRDRLIASCEAGATKSDGDLFRATWPDAGGPEGQTVWHIGNHLWADVAMAAVAGFEPVPLIEADATRYEAAMASGAGSYGPAVAGAARLARLEIEADRRDGTIDGPTADIRILGADVAGQTMTAFVLWIAEQSRSEGIDHLGFLARDGELPLRLAQAMPADHWGGRRMFYLQCSRRTWSLAAAAALGIEQWIADGTTSVDSFLHVKRHEIPLSALLSRIGLTAAELAAAGSHKRLAALDSAAPLPEVAVSDWKSLLADQVIQEQIEARAADRLSLITDWLRSQNMPDGRYGLVDVGWRGRLAAQVSAVMTEVMGEEPIHYHFGGDKVIPDVDAKVRIRRFAFDGISDPYPIEGPVSCIETLTASGNPRVVDYRRAADGQVELVFDRESDGESDRTELWAGALQMATHIPSHAEMEQWSLDPRPLAAETVAVLDHWWNHPTETEVRALDGLRFEHDEAGTTFRPLVAPYRYADFGRREHNRRQWPQGSAVASSGPMAGIARSVVIGRRIRRRLSR